MQNLHETVASFYKYELHYSRHFCSYYSFGIYSTTTNFDTLTFVPVLYQSNLLRVQAEKGAASSSFCKPTARLLTSTSGDVMSDFNSSAPAPRCEKGPVQVRDLPSPCSLSLKLLNN